MKAQNKKENVVSFNKHKDVQNIPVDLISLRDLERKFNFSYSYLYKIIVREKRIPYFSFGVKRKMIKISEALFIEFINMFRMEEN